MTLYEITEQKLYYFRYSKNTIETYLHYVNRFENWVNKHHSRLTAKDVQTYISNYKFTSSSQQSQIISALKFAWEKGLGKKYLKIDFKRPRKEKRIPRIIDKDFLIRKIKAITNKKHRAIIQLAFSTGMRVSEVINLKIKDIDSDRMVIRIHNAKGNKDRIVKLTEQTLEVLRSYFREHQPITYLFNGQFGGKYSSGSCNKIVKKYLGDDYHFHLLRHASLTSMIDCGTDVSIVQKIAGHNSLKTTSGYLHVSKRMINKVYAPI